MAWIRTVAPDDATGRLRKIYDEAVRRAGRVFNVVRLQSPRPRVLEASLRLYQEIMLSPRSALSRVEREMIATAVSATNGCHY